MDYFRSVIALRDKKQAEALRIENEKKKKLAEEQAELNKQSKFGRKEKSLILVESKHKKSNS